MEEALANAVADLPNCASPGFAGTPMSDLPVAKLSSSAAVEVALCNGMAEVFPDSGDLE